MHAKHIITLHFVSTCYAKRHFNLDLLADIMSQNIYTGNIKIVIYILKSKIENYEIENLIQSFKFWI